MGSSAAGRCRFLDGHLVGDYNSVMNALVITDLHAHAAWPFSRPLPNGRSSRFQDLLNVLAQVEQRIEAEGVRDLIVAGDVTHRRHFVTFRLYNDLMAALARLAERVTRTHF